MTRCPEHGDRLLNGSCSSCDARVLRKRETLATLGNLVVSDARIEQLEGEIEAIRKSRGYDVAHDVGADPSERSKNNGPAARRLGQLRARQLAEVEDLNARGAGRVERNRMLARHQRELDQARGDAALEAYNRSIVKADYDRMDALHRKLEN